MATYNGTSHSQLGDSPADFLLKQKHGGVSVPLVSVERQSCWRPGNPSFAPFEVGQLVKRETQRPGNLLTGKFEQRFDGPFKVKSRNSNDVTYTLERDTGAELRAHHTQLRPWITAPSYLRRLEELHPPDHPAVQRHNTSARRDEIEHRASLQSRNQQTPDTVRIQTC
ncbi:hypothetical protein FJT64_017905 [Amphibalanus amphitrite]|uniref:Uncharacterized protein n=1 Tax=Amphibalanus amphitrite TaxID=1232801 RepID=A0A6A4X583_AMPAM|nr:hypothetical protein FJT64_017905 [Amphibalanus amphitrite]